MKKSMNILIAGVGGQGLVLSTRILGTVAFREGYDIKTSDVIGLSQRGGKIWGSVRFGEIVHSPLVPEGECDLLLGMEKLEALRWAHYLRSGAPIILNDSEIYPNRVLIEKEKYPLEIEYSLDHFGKVHVINGLKLASEAGNEKTISTVLLGAASRFLPFETDTWLQVLEESVPKKTIAENHKAFQLGRTLKV